VPAGQNLPNDVFQVNNTGEGTLNFSASDDVARLSVSPASASSPGPPRAVTIAYNAASLTVGDYETAIRVASTNAAHSPQTVTVKLHVLPPACFWEPFSYYDGNLTTMGSVNWSGSATNQILLEDGALKIVGGAGAVSATHPVSCGGSNGLMAVHAKVRQGTGRGDFFWNIAVDDSAGNNLARWYGGSTLARGRVGGTVTDDMVLSGAATWDDLYIAIDSAANTSEFFFNGTSFGRIDHGTAAGNTVGAIRLERLDRLSAASDDVHLDDLCVGDVDPAPPRLQFSRVANTLILAWPATGRGAHLESTPSLALPVQWSAVTNAITLTNGHNRVVGNLTEGSGFFRLRRP